MPLNLSGGAWPMSGYSFWWSPCPMRGCPLVSRFTIWSYTSAAPSYLRLFPVPDYMSAWRTSGDNRSEECSTA